MIEVPLLFIVADRYGSGGVEQMMMRYVEALHPQEVFFISFGGFSSMFVENVELQSINNRRIDLSNKSLYTLFKFILLVKRYRPSLIVAGMTYSNLAVSLCSFFSKDCAMVATVHGPVLNKYSLFEVCKKKILYKFFASRVLNLIVSYQNYMILSNFGVNMNNVKHLPNWIQHTHKSLSGLKEQRVIFCGRLEIDKDPEKCLRIFSHLKAKDLSLHFYGVGSLAEKLEKQVAELGLAARVKFRGYLENWVIEVTPRTVLLLTSRHEAFGLVVYEVLSAGGIAIVPALLLPEFTDFVSSGRIFGYVDEVQCVSLLDNIIDKISTNTIMEHHQIHSLGECVSRYNQKKFTQVVFNEIYKRECLHL